MKGCVEPIKEIKDLQKVTKYFEKMNDIKYSVIFQIGLYSGLRVSDIVSLNIDDVENKTSIEIIERKTGKLKKFPLNEKTQKIIKDYLLIRKQQWSYDEFRPLFIGKMHARLDRSQVYRMITKACYECGLKGNYGTHTMRKTFGYHHYQQFKDVALLQKIFNHSAPSITLRYIGIEQEELDNAYRQFGYNYKKNYNAKCHQSKIEKRYEDIENGLEYLMQLYKKINSKVDKILKIYEEY